MDRIKKLFEYKVSLLTTLIVAALLIVLFSLKGAQFPKDSRSHMIITRDDHSRIEKIVKPGALIFIGDSHIAAIPNGLFFENSINYGIGFQTSQNLYDNLELYQSLKTARAVIIEIGTNDAIRGELNGFIARLDAIVSVSPPNTKIILNTIPPVSKTAQEKVPQHKIDALNAAIKTVCARHNNCQLLDLNGLLLQSGTPLESLLNKDGIHLSPIAYDIWIKKLLGITK